MTDCFMNLRHVYGEWRSRAASSIEDVLSAEFYPPLLIAPPTDWLSVQHRIVYIGQETLGWSLTPDNAQEFGYTWIDNIFTLGDFIRSERSVEALMDAYRQFDFASRQPRNYNSPFWRYFRQIKVAAQRKGGKALILFSNVIRCAANRDEGFTLSSIPEGDRLRYLKRQNGILQAELSVLQPTLLIFVTGPHYDRYLNDEFADLHYSPVAGFDLRVLAKLDSSRLPSPAYRTYHPGYLNRKMGFVPFEAALSDSGGE